MKRFILSLFVITLLLVTATHVGVIYSPYLSERVEPTPSLVAKVEQAVPYSISGSTVYQLVAVRTPSLMWNVSVDIVNSFQVKGVHY